MADVMKRKIEAGEYSVIEKKGKSKAWLTFRLVVDKEGKPLDYAQCAKCKVVLAYDSKKVGTSTMTRHVEKVCPGESPAGTAQQQTMQVHVVKPAESQAASDNKMCNILCKGAVIPCPNTIQKYCVGEEDQAARSPQGCNLSLSQI